MLRRGGRHGETPAGLRGEFLQAGGVDPAAHDVAGLVAVLAVREILVRDDITLLGANCDGEDIDPGLLRLCGETAHPARGFVAVGQQNQGVFLLSGILERLDRQFQGVFQIRAADRDVIRVELFDGFPHRRVIDRERREKVGLAGEADQADPVVRQGFHQFVAERLRLCQPVGLHVADQHAPRDVQAPAGHCVRGSSRPTGPGRLRAGQAEGQTGRVAAISRAKANQRGRGLPRRSSFDRSRGAAKADHCLRRNVPSCRRSHREQGD